MNLIIVLLIILLAAVIAFYIIRVLPLPADVKNVAMIVVGVIFLIALIVTILPLIGVHIPTTVPQ
jgi:hypothetical protein